ncbi:hypothetical protein ARMGADRAFT_347292 [Armillaria gallica]|uniref:Uncharacterized protein n=1 Tax=Armillaria gallica TaxID=47427 RepID=A0A2H3D140_ARMGA|nr:hypothetical protein ARMGADRAFT_347292 [Armillaria gallica]
MRTFIDNVSRWRQWISWHSWRVDYSSGPLLCNALTNTIQSLMTLYQTILNTIVSELQSDKVSKGRDIVMDILGAIMVARTPQGMTADLLDALVLTNNDLSAQHILNKLGSVVKISGIENHGFIQLNHNSFNDFLQDQEQSGDKWYIDIGIHEKKLAKRCLSALTTFLASWMLQDKDYTDITKKACHDMIPYHILNYAIIGPLWHIRCFDASDFAEISSLFGDQLSSWLQVVSIAGKECSMLNELTEVLYWVNHSTSNIDHSFRLLIYHACQHAEQELISRMWNKPPIQPCTAQVHWDNILTYSSTVIPEIAGREMFSVSADSQILVATTKISTTLTLFTSWNISTGIKSDTKPLSSFFDSEEFLKDSQYDVLGCLITRSGVVDYSSMIKSHSQSNWKIIHRFSVNALADESMSAYISIYDIQTLHCYHYIFKGLKTYKLLLYATGVVIIDPQTNAFMRISVNSADRHIPSIWTKIGEENVSEYCSSGESNTSSQYSFLLSELDYLPSNVWSGASSVQVWEYFSKPQLCHQRQQKNQFVVSNDGLTLAHFAYSRERDLSKNVKQISKPKTTGFQLRCWSTTTGAIFSTSRMGMHKCETAPFKGISTNGTKFLILATKFPDLYLHIISCDNDNTKDDMISLQKRSIHSMAFFPDDRHFAYVTNEEMIIRDVQEKRDIFCHRFLYDTMHNCDDRPLAVVITPNGKTLITVHPSIIRTWCISAF